MVSAMTAWIISGKPEAFVCHLCQFWLANHQTAAKGLRVRRLEYNDECPDYGRFLQAIVLGRLGLRDTI